MSFFSGGSPPLPSMVPRPVRKRDRVFLVMCHNYDDSWVCGCFIDDEEAAQKLEEKLEKEAKHIRKPGYDPQYYVDTYKDGEIRD